MKSIKWCGFRVFFHGMGHSLGFNFDRDSMSVLTCWNVNFDIDSWNYSLLFQFPTKTRGTFTINQTQTFSKIIIRVRWFIHDSFNSIVHNHRLNNSTAEIYFFWTTRISTWLTLSSWWDSTQIHHYSCILHGEYG